MLLVLRLLRIYDYELVKYQYVTFMLLLNGAIWLSLILAVSTCFKQLQTTPPCNYVILGIITLVVAFTFFCLLAIALDCFAAYCVGFTLILMASLTLVTFMRTLMEHFNV